MPASFDLQGHRGARGLRPENTLPAFETALDVGVTTIETDLHLTRDGVPVLVHDPYVTPRLFRPPGGTGSGATDALAVASLTLSQLQAFRADRNPDPVRFPDQDAGVTPLAQAFADRQGRHPYAPPSLADLLAFVQAYAGDLGRAAGKSDTQRHRAAQVRFDLELKRVPARPEWIGDGFTGSGPGRLERQVIEAIRSADVVARTIVRSFDHRAVLALRELEPWLTTAVLVAGTAPVAPLDLVRRAGAQVYCPDHEYLDERQIHQLHAAGIRVVPWTVNDPSDWARLLAWNVDGITTDFTDRLAAFLTQRGVPF